MFIKILVLSISGVIIIDFFKEYNKSFSSVIGLAVLLAAISVIIKYLLQFKGIYENYCDMLYIDSKIIKDTCKLTFIMFLKSVSYDFCLENGYKSLSGKIDLASKIAAASIVLPYIQRLYVNIIKLFL